MKKIIIAASVVITTGMFATITKNNNVKAEKVAKVNVVYDKTISLGTAD